MNISYANTEIGEIETNEYEVLALYKKSERLFLDVLEVGKNGKKLVPLASVLEIRDNQNKVFLTVRDEIQTYFKNKFTTISYEQEYFAHLQDKELKDFITPVNLNEFHDKKVYILGNSQRFKNDELRRKLKVHGARKAFNLNSTIDVVIILGNKDSLEDIRTRMNTVLKFKRNGSEILIHNEKQMWEALFVNKNNEQVEKVSA